MTDSTGAARGRQGLRSRQWLLTYKTSSTRVEGRPLDMLHDFYIPALRLAARYDRVAGYFRSSSLAAASQGFSAFAGKGGRMRLVVGADLDPEDVRAALSGDRDRLAAALGVELAHGDSWPEGVRNGVTLLAWMVARGHLEIRVAFRIHGGTGEPIPFDAVDDGYVHEKWFLMQDESGDRLYGSGSLNESRTALVTKAENLDVHCDWWGERERQRVDEAEAAFEDLWAGNVPHMPVMTLPEAVRLRLIEMGESVERPVEVDGTDAAPRVASPPSALERLRFAVVRDAPKMPGGRFVGMETAPVAPWPHQAAVARRLIEGWPYNFMLCDEVGLGKTFEAGFAFRSLFLSGLAKRILVSAPASVATQWQRQLGRNFLMPFGRALGGAGMRHGYVFPFEETRPSDALYDPDLAIVSTGLLSRRKRWGDLQDAGRFDIALVDEAHAARRREPTAGASAERGFGYLYQAIEGVLIKRTRSLWLATATPMQIHPVEVCDLLALTGRVGAFQFDATLTLEYYDALGRLVRGEDLIEQEWEFLRRTVASTEAQDPLLWQFLQSSAIDGRVRLAADRWLRHGRIPQGRDRELMRRLIFAASPLSRVMLRHTRSLLEIYRRNGELQDNLARRHVLPMPKVEMNEQERAAYEGLEAYCRGLSRQIGKQPNARTKHSLGFLLSFLRLRFASSLHAIRETLRRRLERVEATLAHQRAEESGEWHVADTSLEELLSEGEEEDDRDAVASLLKDRTPADLEWERRELGKLAGTMRDISGPSTKMQELMRALDGRRKPASGRVKQTVVFTRFFDTLCDIVERLLRADPNMLIGTYSGQGKGGQILDRAKGRMVWLDREKVKDLFFAGAIDVLVCTDAAAEGLDLQTADLIVNFDLGWNPMKVEQRIGRIDRIGQRHSDIYVLNLCYLGSAEEIVYNRLLSRLAQAHAIVGAQQVSMLPVELDEFRELAEGTLGEEELERRARERIEAQKQRTESMEIPPQDMYEIYVRMAQERGPERLPASLDTIWKTLTESRHLRELGCAASADESVSTLRIFGIPGAPDGALLTASRELYAHGIPGSESRPRFASYGEPCFDALLAQVERHELPPCVRRLSVKAPGMDGAELVGYAVACAGAGGNREVRLVTSWRDLDGIQIIEGDELSDADVQPHIHRLEDMAREEFRPYQAAPRIARDNLKAAQGQLLLDLLVIRALLAAPGIVQDDGQVFSTVYRSVVEPLLDREQLYVPNLEANRIRMLKESAKLLFDVEAPRFADNASMEAPRPLLRAAAAQGEKAASAMKMKKADLTVGAVARSIEQRIRRSEKKLLSGG